MSRKSCTLYINDGTLGIMPVKACSDNERPGYKWGDSGKCYTYASGDEAGKKRAKEKARLQGVAAGYKIRNWLDTTTWQQRIRTFVEKEDGNC